MDNIPKNRAIAQRNTSAIIRSIGELYPSAIERSIDVLYPSAIERSAYFVGIVSV